MPTAPPLGGHTQQGGACAPPDPLMCRARCGAAPPASRVLRIADATGLRPALDPGASTTPWASQTRAGTGPAPGRRTTHLQDQKDRKITTSEVSTVSGDCQICPFLWSRG